MTMKYKTKRKLKITTILMTIGVVVAVLAYVWARMTYTDNIESGQPNSFAGILGLAGIVTAIVSFIVSKFSKKK